MLRFVRQHSPAIIAFVLMLLVFAGFAGTFGPEIDPIRGPVSATPAQPIPLPGPDRDQDNDTYADPVDLWEGDLLIQLDVTRLRLPDSGAREPYLLVGTQDDQWRTGAAGELEWRRVYDHDPFGHSPGSPSWIQDALRTGVWWQSIPAEGERYAIARSGSIDAPEAEVHWPQTFMVNVRDDRGVVRIDLELWDAEEGPHALRGRWSVDVDVQAAMWRPTGSGTWQDSGATATLGSLERGRSGLEISVRPVSDLSWDTKGRLAERWAPVLHFADGERFFPTRGEALEQFHGFVHREPDHRTWQRTFNNGRDAYRLLLADFTGEGTVDHQDAAVLTDVLRAGPVATRTVYAHIGYTTGNQIFIQYWFIHFYNFVPDESGRDIAYLAHSGDREFIQLLFSDLEAATDGAPLRVSYSQHYEGVRIPYEPGEPPFHIDPDRPAVFSALGSHASYPAAGTDEALRRSLSGFGDIFHGDGEVWSPEDYELELLGPQQWHAGYLWGPHTRHSRDLGTTARPLLQHHFVYPFTDPLAWERSLKEIDADLLENLYGGSS